MLCDAETFSSCLLIPPNDFDVSTVSMSIYIFIATAFCHASQALFRLRCEHSLFYSKIRGEGRETSAGVAKPQTASSVLVYTTQLNSTIPRH